MTRYSVPALTIRRPSTKWDTSARSFDQAIDELLQPDALERASREIHEITGYVVFGEYGRILSGYLDVFGESSYSVLFTAELEADPHSALSSIFEFLGVDPEFVPDNLGTSPGRHRSAD